MFFIFLVNLNNKLDFDTGIKQIPNHLNNDNQMIIFYENSGLIRKTNTQDIGYALNKKRQMLNLPLYVPGAGIEPVLCCQNWILNPARLPVPPPGQNIISSEIQREINIFLFLAAQKMIFLRKSHHTNLLLVQTQSKTTKCKYLDKCVLFN